jgi:SPP1 gp7 family putative phage head morphogenesis protein
MKITKLHKTLYLINTVLGKIVCEDDITEPNGIKSSEKKTVENISRKIKPINDDTLEEMSGTIKRIDPESDVSINKGIEKLKDKFSAHGKKVAPVAAEVITKDTEKVYKKVKKTLSNKVNMPFYFIAEDERAIQRITKFEHIFVRSHYQDDDGVTKEVYDIIIDTINKNKGAMSRTQIAQELTNRMTTLVEGKAYYQIVASQVLNNARSYSSMRFYDDNDITQYEVSAVNDDRTTEQCRFMDGRILTVSQTLENFKRYDSAKSIDDVKDIVPWLDVEMVDDMAYIYHKGKLLRDDITGEELQAMGINAPPYHGNSYSEDTEIYTNEGWKFVTDLTGKELFLSPNPDGMKIEWVKAIKTTYYKPNGKMINFKSQNMDLLVTENHDQVYSKLPWNKTKFWKMEKANKLIEKQKIYIPRCANWIGNDLKSIKIGNDDLEIITFLKFMAYWLSDGSVTKRHRNSYYICIGNRKSLDKIFNDVKNLPYRIYKRKKGIEFYNPDMGKYLSQFGHAQDKFIPNVIKELRPELLTVFLNAYLVCDGSIVKTNGKFGSDNSFVKTFFSTSKRLADDLGECILKSGMYPSFNLQKQKGKIVKILNHIVKCNYDIWRIRINKSKTATFGKNGKGNIEIVLYSGLAYCVELEKNHILWVRRNGKTCFSGNCRTTVFMVL